MRTIPSAVQTLLKSRSMIGANKPSYEVTVEGLSGGWITPETPVRIYQGYGSTATAISNWIKKTDGDYMCCWVDVTTLELQTGFSADLGFMTTNYAIDSVVTTSAIKAFTADELSQCALYKRADGKVLMILLTGRGANCYISNSGNGDDWTFYSTVYDLGGAGSGDGYLFPGVVTPTGRIIFSGTMPSEAYDSYFDKLTFIYPDDEGETWGYVPKSSAVYTNGAGQL